MHDIGIYARVSTTDQNPQRQLDELREFAEETYNEPFQLPCVARY